MLHMADHVEVNYENLERMKSSFDQQAQEAENMLRKISGQVDNLQGGQWVGQGANAFYNEMHGLLLPAVQRLVKSLQEGSRVVGQIMTEFKNAEEESRSVWEPF
jgi:WXG100 family type VII secretion target